MVALETEIPLLRIVSILVLLQFIANRPVVCYTNDGKNTTRFMPIFPSTCPLSVSFCILLPREAYRLL